LDYHTIDLAIPRPLPIILRHNKQAPRGLPYDQPLEELQDDTASTVDHQADNISADTVPTCVGIDIKKSPQSTLGDEALEHAAMENEHECSLLIKRLLKKSPETVPVAKTELKNDQLFLAAVKNQKILVENFVQTDWSVFATRPIDNVSLETHPFDVSSTQLGSPGENFTIDEIDSNVRLVNPINSETVEMVPSPHGASSKANVNENITQKIGEHSKAQNLGKTQSIVKPKITGKTIKAWWKFSRKFSEAVFQ